MMQFGYSCSYSMDHAREDRKVYSNNASKYFLNANLVNNNIL